MNPATTYQDWFPHETDEYLRAAIARVNGDSRMGDFEGDRPELAVTHYDADKQRIAELEAQVTRLQNLVMEIANDHNNWLEDDPELLRSMTRHWVNKVNYDAYEWGDLDPVKGQDDGE